MKVPLPWWCSRGLHLGGELASSAVGGGGGCAWGGHSADGEPSGGEDGGGGRSSSDSSQFAAVMVAIRSLLSKLDALSLDLTCYLADAAHHYRFTPLTPFAGSSSAPAWWIPRPEKHRGIHGLLRVVFFNHTRATTSWPSARRRARPCTGHPHPLLRPAPDSRGGRGAPRRSTACAGSLGS